MIAYLRGVVHEKHPNQVIVEAGGVDLADGGRGDRLGIEGVEDVRRGAAEVFDKGPFDVRVGEGRDPVKQVEEGVAVGPRQDVRLQRQDLAEFQETAADLLEQHAQPLRPADAAAADELRRAVLDHQPMQPDQSHQYPEIHVTQCTPDPPVPVSVPDDPPTCHPERRRSTATPESRDLGGWVAFRSRPRSRRHAC